MANHPARFLVRPHNSGKIGAQSPMRTITWQQGIFAKEAVNGLGRREAPPASYFPSAHQRYAAACRGDISDEVVAQGQLQGLYTACPWFDRTGVPRGPSSTQCCFEALMGMDANEDLTVEQMRAWVSAAAPPLVYDGARARHEKAPQLHVRDQLAARFRAKAEQRELEKPAPPLSRRMQRVLSQDRLRAVDERAAREMARIDARRAAIERQEAAALKAAQVESRKLKKKGW